MNARAKSFLSSRSRSRTARSYAAFSIAMAAVACGSPAGAQTSTPPVAVDSSALLSIVGRLGPLGYALIAAGVIIVVLLVVRIWSMIRREQPIRPPAARRRGGADTLSRATMSATTDWGFDQNKRAALARSAVPIDEASPGISSMDSAATLWSPAEVVNAAAISRQANDSMGKSPHQAPSPYTTSQNPYFRGESSTTAPIEVVEVADALLQAELLVQLGDPKQAMILLSQHIRDTEQPGPAVWLMLLGLYQSTGRKSQYEALTVGFKTLFNAAVPPWATSAETMARDLESYPQVIANVQAGWTKQPMRQVLENLLNDDRGGSRQGFSLTAYRDILFLLEILVVLDQMTQEEIERGLIQRKLGPGG